MRVKGSVFASVVKRIRKDKSGVYDKYLTDEDKRVINQRILPGSWYPYDTFRRCMAAVFDVVAGNDPEVARMWGREACLTITSKFYQAATRGQPPASYVQNYQHFNKNGYDFTNVEGRMEGEHQAVFNLLDIDAKCAAVMYTTQGWIEQGLELCGAKEVKSEFLSKRWEGAPKTLLRVTWT